MTTDSADDEDFEQVDFDVVTKSIKLINRGSFGEVYGPVNWNSKQFAIKKIWISQEKRADSDVESKVTDKRILWTSLKHEHLIKIYYVTLSPTAFNLHVIMEFASGGSLRQLLNKSDVNSQHQRYVSTWARQIADGMLYLHDEKNIVHRDLKSGNSECMPISFEPRTECYVLLTVGLSFCVPFSSYSYCMAIGDLIIHVVLLICFDKKLVIRTRYLNIV